MIGTPQMGFAGTAICAERYISPEPASTSAARRANDEDDEDAVVRIIDAGRSAHAARRPSALAAPRGADFLL